MAGKSLVHTNFVSSLRRTASFLMSRVRDFHSSTSLNEDTKKDNSRQDNTADYVSSLFSDMEPSAPPFPEPEKIVSKSAYKPIFRTHVSDPNEHTMMQEGMFYRLDLKEFNSTFPNSITDYIRDQVDTLNEASIMVRQPAVECINILKNLSTDVPMPRIVLYGREGTGKTVSMAHVIHYCTRNDWVIFHVPWVPDLLTKDNAVTPSDSLPNKFDLPGGARDLLKYFEDKNKHLLTKFNTKTGYSWTETEETPANVPLLELVQFGQHRFKFSCDVVGVLLKELQQLSNEKKFKLLIAIDGLNSFWSENGMKHEGKKIHMQDLSLVHHFQECAVSENVNSVLLCTTDALASPNVNKKEYRPKQLLGKQGFELFDPFIPILVPNYSEKEIYSALHYYEDLLWIQDAQARTDKGKEEIIFLSGHNPKYLTKIIDPL